MTSPMKPSPQPTEPARKPVAPNSSPNAPKGGMPKEPQNDSKHSPSRPTQNDSKQPAGGSNRDSKGSHGVRKDDSAPNDPSRPILGGSVKLAPSSDGSTDDSCDPTAKSGDACATPRGATPRNAVNPANPAKSAGS